MTSKMTGDETDKFTKFDKQLFNLMKISPFIYGTDVIYRMNIGSEQYWGSLLIPLMMVFALWTPSGGSLLFIRISTVILCVMHGLQAAWIGIFLLYGEAGNVVLSQELILRRSILSIYFFLLCIVINYYKTLFLPEETSVAVWKKVVLTVLALSIPLYPWAERIIKTALDPTLIKYSEPIRKMNFSHDGKQLAAISGDSLIVWDVRTKKVTKLISQKGGMWSIAFSQDGKYLAAGRESDTDDPNDNVYMDVWKLPSRELMNLQRNEGPDRNQFNVVNMVSFSSDSRYLASIMKDSKFGTLLIDRWDMQTGKLLDTRKLVATKELRSGSGSELGYSADGRYLAAMGMGDIIYLWDITSGNLVRTLKTGYSGWAEAIAFSPDGEYLALAFNREIKSKAGSHKGTVIIWKLETGEQLRTLEWDSDLRVYRLAYSPDGRYLASCGDEDFVRIWNAQSGEPVKILEGHPERFLREGLTYSPDGKYLAAQGWEYIKIRNIEP